MPPVRIGTVDIPERIERERYFQELDYLELSALFAGPLKPSAITRWKDLAPPGAHGLVAPWVLTSRKPPRAERLWDHDATVGDFRDSVPGRAALAAFHAAVSAVGAAHAVFPSPPLFAPSTANREQLRRFFAETATEDTAGAPRVWIPDGLWEPRAAVAFATEIGVTCALDPLVYDPARPDEVYEDLEAPALYFRVTGLGRSGPIQTEKLEDLAALVEHYQNIPLTLAFASTARWQDARNFKKLLAGAP
ncbi:MAG: DUF72 domain-containing protein [Deltaproteobacteria bacterium]|nr:MAG: DUF72 domain-containing protein [Deltaproteobacteria bacterium]